MPAGRAGVSQPMNRTGSGAGGDVVLVALGGVVLGSTAIVWGGAWFAALLAGGTVSGGVGAVSYTHLTLPTNREV